MATTKIKTFRWTEPLAVRSHFYPPKRLDVLSWPILAGVIFVAMLLVVILTHNPDPNAKWLVLGIAAVLAGFIGFVAPRMLARSNTCTINDFGIQRSGGFPRFELAAIRFHAFAWDWYSIDSLELQKRVIDGVERSVILVHGRNGSLLGCVGLESESQVPVVQAWVDVKKRPLHVEKTANTHAAGGSCGEP